MTRFESSCLSLKSGSHFSTLNFPHEIEILFPEHELKYIYGNNSPYWNAVFYIWSSVAPKVRSRMCAVQKEKGQGSYELL